MESHEPAHTAIPPTSSCTKYHNPKAGVKQRPAPPPLRFAVLVADTLLSMSWVGTTEEDRLYSAATRTARAVILPAALIIIACLMALACGSGEGDGGNGGNDGRPGRFNVTMGDNFYEPNKFTVKAGQKLTFQLKNEGIAIHNMRVSGADNKYNTEDDALSDPTQIRPGDTGRLEWTAPDKAGEIKLRCEFHPTDSTGIIKVE